MKQKGKKVVGLVACSMFFVASAISLAACGGGEKHDLKQYSAQEATCTEAGHIAHYQCKDCGKYYEDAEAKKELAESDVVIPAKGHKPTERKAADPSCFEVGYSVDHWYCANGCGTIWSDNGNTVMADSDDLIIPATEHKGTIHHVDYEAATIDKDGHIAHWHCDLCEKDFEDEFGDNEIENVSIPKLEEVAANVNVFVYDAEGKPDTDTSGLALTLASNVKTYTNVTVSEGKLSLTKMYEGEYTVTVTGYEETKITVGKTAVELLLIPSFIQNSNQHDKGTVSWSVEKTESGISKSVTLDAVDEDDKNGANQLETKRTEAQLLLTDEQKNASVFALYTTVKFQNTKNNKSAVDRGGFLLTKNAAADGKDYGGFVLFCSDKRIDDMPRNHGAGITLNQENKLATYDLYEALGAGMQVRIMRLNTLITFSVWENDAWKLLCTNTCSESDINDIRFLGASGKWEFSNVVIETGGELEVVSAVDPTPESDGNVAHYTLTKGTDVKYFLMNGTDTTAEDVILPKITEIAADITVNLIGTNGNKITDTSAIKFNLKSVSYEYPDITLTNGKLPSQLYEGEYTITADGFGKGKFVVEKDGAPVTLTLYQGFENSNPTNSSSVAIAYEKDGDSVTQKVTLVSNGSGVSSIYENRAEVQLLLIQDQKNADYMIVSGKLKFTGKNDGLARAGMTMTEGWNGFMLWHQSNRIDEHVANGNLDQYNEKGTISYNELTAGIEFRMVRTGTAIRLYIKGANGWALRASVSCAEDAVNDIRFAGGLGTWEYTDLTVTTPEYAAVEAKAPTVEADGNIAHYTLTTNGTVEYFLPDGTPSSKEGVTIAKLVETTVSVSVTPLDYDGTAVDPIAANTAVKLTSVGATYNTTVTADGKLARTTFAKGTYVVEIDGFATGRLVIGDEAQAELVVYKPFATDGNTGNDFTSFKYEAYKTQDGVSKTVTINNKEDGNLGACLEAKHGDAKLNLTDAQKAAKGISITATVTLKTGDLNAADRSGIMLTNDKGGFIFREDRIDEMDKWHGAGITLNDARNANIYNGALSMKAGFKVKLERYETFILLSVWKDDAWTVVLEGTCAANAENEIRLMGAHGVWEFADVAIETYTVNKTEYVAPTTTAAGTLAYVTIGTGENAVSRDMLGKVVNAADMVLPKLGEDVEITVENQFNGNKGTNTEAAIEGTTVTATAPRYSEVPNTVTLTPTSTVGTDFVLNFNVKIEGGLQGATDRMAFSLSATGEVYRIYNRGGWKIGHGQRMENDNKWLDQDKGEQATIYRMLIESAITSSDGLNLSFIRQGNNLTVLAQLGGEWVKLDSFAVSGDAEFKIHYGGDFDGNQTWTFSDIALNTLAAQD